MDDDKKNQQNEQNEYLFKILYLIRTNLPTSEYLYLIMFFIKYVGLILFSISLNEWEKENPEKMMNNKSNSSIINIQKVFSKFLINGNDLKILENNYESICLIGFFAILIYTFFIIYGVINMRKKYYNKNSQSSIDKKIKRINNNSKFEKRLFKFLSYIFFLIVFFHQYIIEYFIFGIIGSFLYIFGILDKESFNTTINKDYSIYINSYFKNINFNTIFILVICLISIIIIFALFLLFMLLNSTKTLFLNAGIPFYGNKKYLFLKIILYNFSPLYGFLNMLGYDLKIKITLIIITINLVIILTGIALSFYSFSFYPNKVIYMCNFIELFSLVSIITELIIYLTDAEFDSPVYKLILELINSFILTSFFIYKKDEYNLKLFAQNLFVKSFKKMNADDIYYYFVAYIKYSKNKENNYIEIFKLIQNHTLFCDKKDCPCSVLIPIYMSYSPYTNLNNIKIDDSKSKKKKDINVFENNGEINNSKLLAENKAQNNETNILESNTEINQYGNMSINNQNINMSINNEYEKSIERRRKISFHRQSIAKKEKEKEKEKEKDKETSIIMKNSIINKIPKDENNNNININNNDNTKEGDNAKINYNEKLELEDEHFIMLGEQEIINRIYFLNKRKNYDTLQTYIFIHLQYIIKIKQNFRLALYFVYKYSVSDIKFEFLSRYFLYEIKKYINKSIINLNNTEKVKDPYITKYREDNIAMKKLVNYISLYRMIKKLLEISCGKIIYFNTFKSELHNSLALQKYVKLKIYPIVASAEEIETSISKLKFLIEKYNKKENNHIESIELCYLISNFFTLINGKISQDILENISPVLYFKETHYIKLGNEFHLFMMSNPLIISLTKKDTFNISYFTNIFLDKLGYNYSDLKNKDFHEKLFPGEKELAKEHSYVMKQFLFFNKNTYSKAKTFLKSKEGYLISINFVCKTFPNFSDNFFLISNIRFNDNSEKQLIEDTKKSCIVNINNDNIINNYSFMLNQDFEFFGLTKNFFLEYELNHNMFRELNINFCQFFCIEENKLKEQIHNEKKKLIKKFPYLKNKISLKESNKAYSIFQNISIENTFKLRDEKLLNHYLHSTVFIHDKIDKKKMIFKIPEIMGIIDENGLDYNWYERLENFRKRFIENCNIKDIPEDFGDISPNNRPFTGNLKRQSTVMDNNKLAPMFIDSAGHFFEVIYAIKKLGYISYYVVYLKEAIKANISIIKKENTKEEINNKEEIKNKIASIPNSKRYSSAHSLNFSKFMLGNVKTIKEANYAKRDSNGNGIERKAQTNYINKDVLFTQNTLGVQSSKINNNLLMNSASEERVNQYDSKFKLEEKTEGNENENEKEKEKEKEINSKDIIKKNSIKEKSKLQKKLEKKESKKSKKKEFAEDEENEPLIEKNKFNEQLTKNKKRNKIFIIFINLISIILIILVMIKFFISEKGFTQTKSVLKATIYLEMLKIDIYVQAILSIIYCINEKENITDIDSVQSESKLKIKSTLEHLKILQDQINIILNNKNSARIISILQEKRKIYILNDDWTPSQENVELLSEIRSLSYKLYDLSNTNQKCDIITFYEYEKSGPEIFKNGMVDKANDIQKIIYYFLRNIFSAYKSTFDELSEESASTIEKMWVNYQYIIYCLLFSIIVLMIIFIIIYIIKINFDFSFYQLLFLYYYNIENEKLKFENQIYYLYKTIQEFSIENISYFEFFKHNADLIDYSQFKNTEHIKIVKNDLNQPTQDKNENAPMKDHLSRNKNKNFDKNSTALSLLNSSMNRNSFHVLNNAVNKNNQNNRENNSSFASSSNEKEEEKKISQEETIDSFLHLINKILPNSLKISLIFIILSTIIYLSLTCTNITELLSENKIFKYSINLSMNILERIPNLMGILIYSCLTIITGNENLVRPELVNYNQSKYLTYFKTNSLYYSEDIMNKYFKNKYFGKLLKDTLRINYNFDNYLFQETNDIFGNTKEWEKTLNIKEYFCINAAIGEVLSFQNEYTVYDFTNEINYYATRCKKDNTGINESGAQLEINYILQEITTKYIEFITRNNSNLSIEQARFNFFASQDMKRIIVDMQLSLILYYNTIAYTVTLDFEKKNNKIINEQIIFSAVLFLVNLIIIIGLLFTITKNEKYKELFCYFSEIPNINDN